MRPMKKARGLLKGHWMEAEAILFAKLGVRLFVLCMQFLLLRLSGLGAERVMTARDLYSGQWLYAAIFLLTLLLDWLLVSPLLLGEASFYYRLAEGVHAPVSVAFSFYRRQYTRALRWRLGLFGRRALWTVLCCAPAAAAMGYADFIRFAKEESAAANLELLFCTLLGILLLLAGLLGTGLLMMRYLPASLFLTAEKGRQASRRGFGLSRRIMHSHVGEMFWLYIRFLPWLIGCLLVVPYGYAAPLFYAARAEQICTFASLPCPVPRRKATLHFLTAIEMTQVLR